MCYKAWQRSPSAGAEAGQCLLPRRKIISEEECQHPPRFEGKHGAGERYSVSDRAARLPPLCREPTVGFGRAAAPLTRRRAAGGAVPALPSMQRRGTARNGPAARPPLAPAAPTVARRWRTAAPTCAGRKRHQTPPADPGLSVPPTSFETESGKRWHGHEDVGGEGGDANPPSVPPVGRKPTPGTASCPQPPWPGLGYPKPPGRVLTVPAQPRCIPGST